MSETLFFLTLFAILFLPPLLFLALSYTIYFLENKGYVKMEEEDRLAREIYFSIKLIDPEKISKDDGDILIELSSTTILRIEWNSSQRKKCIYVNGNELNTSQFRINDIIDISDSIFYEESERKRIQEISTDLGL